MRARLFALVGLVVCVGASAQARPEPALEFKQFASSDGRYKILFPGGVRTETTEGKGPSGTVKITLDSVQLDDGVMFLVTYLDFPEDQTKTPAARLERVREGNKGADGKVVADKEIEVGADKYPGRDMLFEKPTLFIRNRAVVAGTRLYQVMLQGPKDVVTSKAADRFLDSFEVTK